VRRPVARVRLKKSNGRWWGSAGIGSAKTGGPMAELAARRDGLRYERGRRGDDR
jgi:hypothetical protein